MSDKLVRNVLVPVDFSPVCRGAARYAIGLTAHFSPTVELIHVWDLPIFLKLDGVQHPSPTHPKSLGEFATERVHAAMTSFLAELEDDFRRAQEASHALLVRHRVASGRAADVIIEAATQGKVDLIVMGTHARHGLSQLLMGSVTSEVIRRAPCPVVAVPPRP